MSLNGHFVSRFLTTPWEFGQRKLWYYDFELDRLKSGFSKSLFAKEGTTTAEVERLLDRLIETPIGAARSRLWAAAREVSQQLEWPLFRALALLFFLQPFRAVEGVEGIETLKQVLTRPEAEIDGLALSIGQRYRLMRVSVAAESPLLYPSDGYFPLIAEPQDGGCAFGFAMPLSERHAFIGIRQSVDPTQIAHWNANGGGFIANYSVGHTSRRVVVHPALVESIPDTELREAIRAARTGVTEAIARCRELTGILRRIEQV